MDGRTHAGLIKTLNDSVRTVEGQYDRYWPVAEPPSQKATIG